MIESGLEEILKNIRLINDYSNNDYIYEVKERLHVFEKTNSSMNNFNLNLNLNFNYYIKKDESNIISQIEKSENMIEEDTDEYVLIVYLIEDYIDIYMDIVIRTK